MAIFSLFLSECVFPARPPGRSGPGQVSHICDEHSFVFCVKKAKRILRALLFKAVTRIV